MIEIGVGRYRFVLVFILSSLAAQVLLVLILVYDLSFQSYLLEFVRLYKAMSFL